MTPEEARQSQFDKLLEQYAFLRVLELTEIEMRHDEVDTIFIFRFLARSSVTITNEGFFSPNKTREAFIKHIPIDVKDWDTWRMLVHTAAQKPDAVDDKYRTLLAMYISERATGRDYEKDPTVITALRSGIINSCAIGENRRMFMMTRFAAWCARNRTSLSPEQLKDGLTGQIDPHNRVRHAFTCSNEILT